MIKEVEGCLIAKALNGEFDVIAHGVNCHCLMSNGLAPQMAKSFGCDNFYLERNEFKGMYDKLGRIDYEKIPVLNLTIVNAYTQYEPGPNADITALRLCLKKINHQFKGKHIGLPLICAGIGGLAWSDVKQVITEELKDVRVTIVHYKPTI
jgi:O-acetyl-ADP-ribose deacetylase (regulator of RNase III)